MLIRISLDGMTCRHLTRENLTRRFNPNPSRYVARFPRQNPTISTLPTIALRDRSRAFIFQKVVDNYTISYNVAVVKGRSAPGFPRSLAGGPVCYYWSLLVSAGSKYAERSADQNDRNRRVTQRRATGRIEKQFRRRASPARRYSDLKKTPQRSTRRQRAVFPAFIIGVG
jgi:hypothetical protein